MALNHNQYAVVAIAATLCLAGFYTIIDAGLSTTESGGFSSAGDKVLPKCKDEFMLDEFEMQILKGLLIDKMENYNIIVENEDYTRDVRQSKLKLNEFQFVKSLNSILTSEEVAKYIEMDFESEKKEKKKKRRKKNKS